MKVVSLLFTFLLFILISGCAQRIKVPINRLILPESIGGGADLEFKQSGFSEGLLQFTNNDTDNPLLMASTNNQTLYMGFSLGPGADVFLQIPEESSSLVGIKIQLVGAHSKESSAGHKLAITLGMGSERDTFEGDFKIDLKSDVQDYSLIHGYRFNPFFMVYEGISISHYSFEGTIENGSALNSDKIEYAARNILGAHLGIAAGGPSFKFKFEFGVQKIKWTNTEEKQFIYTGYALSASF